MAAKPYLASSKKDVAPTSRRGYWSEQIAKAQKRWGPFYDDGDKVIDRFMLESRNNTDKYNILYSSTETIKPSLYGQTPKVEAKNRQVDTEDNLKVAAAMLMEHVGQYAVDMLDFDYVMQNAVSDYVLPGMGQVWVRYEPQFEPMYDNDNKPELNEDGSQKEYLTYEGMALDYVHFKDILMGDARYWTELPWLARKVYFNKEKAKTRFGAEKANKLSYSFNAQDRKDRHTQDSPKRQAIIYEIWDKDKGEVCWFSEDYPDDLLDTRKDPLRLQNFFPCPRPMRAVWSTRTLVPKSLYSQYKVQAAELDRLTERIRYLTEALKVRGLYDGSQENLANVLDGPGNKMIPVQDWASFIGQNGINGSVQWVPITEVVQCLTELFKQREICKNEIYEITGFSDIVRGVSKASETLGAQQIKADWATGRLKDMQREVQRFCRDIVRIFVEIAAEHFSDKSLLLYSGLTIPEPKPEEVQAQQQYAMAVQQAAAMGQPPPPPLPPTEAQQLREMFQKAVKLVRSEKLRCAAVGVETDSTILPDEQKERADRMQFLNSMGAFLQQAGPMALQYPDMRGLLGGIMMFTLRTFSASRPLEKEFEAFQQKMASQPPQPPPGEGGDKGEAQAQATQAAAQLKADTDKQVAGMADATKRYEIDKKADTDRQKAQQDHDYRVAQLDLDRDKLAFEKQKLGLATLAEERDIDRDDEAKAFERGIKAHELDETTAEAEEYEALERDKLALAEQQAEQAQAQLDAGTEEA